MYYNIADRVVRPMLEENYKIAAEAAALAQTKANKAAKIGIKAHKSVFNEDRAQGIIDRVSSQPFDEVKWILDEPVKTFSRSVVDETLESNVEFQGKSGLEPKIVRTAATDACPWCLEVAGTYSYPDVPDDVYRRHANCDCIVEYVEAGKYTDVHSKVEYRSKAERAAKAERRKKIVLKKSTKDDTIKSQEELMEYIGKPIIKTDNQSIREWYVANVSNIPNQVDQSKSIEEQARQAFNLRNQLKHEARVAMTDIETAQFLEETRPAPTFEQLLQGKMKRKGFTYSGAVEDILETSSKTNADANKEFGL